MESIAAIVEREGELLDVLLFKLVETRLLLEHGEHRFLSRSSREVERAHRRAREADLVRAATITEVAPGATLRELARRAHEPWPGILRDHHDRLSALVAEIEATAHRNAAVARLGLEDHCGAQLRSPSGARSSVGVRADPELERLARGASLEAVLGSASRLRMPDLLDFLR